MVKAAQIRDPGIPKNAYLVINNQVVPIVRQKTRIGRKLDNDVVIQDVLVSRQHAKIVFEDGQFTVYDLDSTGGTFINNKKVTKAKLHNGDEINLSNVRVTFLHDTRDLENQAEKSTGRLT